MQHADVRFIAELKSCADYLTRHLNSGDVLITLGAGDVNSVGDWLAQK
jgi:UDP-N-acetylmuramate-alanine ligase